VSNGVNTPYQFYQISVIIVSREMALIFMSSEDSSRPTEDASQTMAGVEGKMNLNQGVSAPNDKPQIPRHNFHRL
jgi:hypothetical protein